MIIIEFKNLSHSLQFKTKYSSMQHHELKKYFEFNVKKKPCKWKNIKILVKILKINFKKFKKALTLNFANPDIYLMLKRVFFFCKNGCLTGDVLKRCKNKWSYGGHNNSGHIQARTMKEKKISFFNPKTSEIRSHFLKYTFLIKWHRFKVKDTYLALNFVIKTCIKKMQISIFEKNILHISLKNI